MTGTRAIGVVTIWLVVTVASATGFAQAPGRFGFGRPATPQEIAAIDIMPDGRGLPAGRGSSAEGAVLYADRQLLAVRDNGV